MSNKIGENWDPLLAEMEELLLSHMSMLNIDPCEQGYKIHRVIAALPAGKRRLQKVEDVADGLSADGDFNACIKVRAKKYITMFSAYKELKPKDVVRGMLHKAYGCAFEYARQWKERQQTYRTYNWRRSWVYPLDRKPGDAPVRRLVLEWLGRPPDEGGKRPGNPDTAITSLTATQEEADNFDPVDYRTAPTQEVAEEADAIDARLLALMDKLPPGRKQQILDCLDGSREDVTPRVLEELKKHARTLENTGDKS